MKIDKRQLRKWINALYSGEFKQGQAMLQIDNKSHCCLGVACKILIPEKDLQIERGCIFGILPKDQSAAPQWLKDIDNAFGMKTGVHLTTLNDDGPTELDSFTFEEIGMLLEWVYMHKALG